MASEANVAGADDGGAGGRFDGTGDGIVARIVETPRLTVNLLEREGDDPDAPAERTVVLVHGELGSARVWQEFLADLPGELRAIAFDLRGYGGTENLPVDATRGVRDFSDDLAATLDALGLGPVHLVGWSLGGAVVQQYALEHPVLSLSLVAPVSPFGFGGTRRDGSRLTDDDAGVGAGTAHPDFVRRLGEGDRGDDAATSPLTVFRESWVGPAYEGRHEQLALDAMLQTSTAAGNYPGEDVASEHWPGFAAGPSGVLNTLAPRWFDVSGIVGLDPKPPILWVHGTADAIVSDESFYDVNHLGALGVVADWPGADVAPAQPMVSQLRDVFDAYRDAGGDVVELAIEEVGHAPHLERPAAVRQALLQRIGYVGPPAEPGLPTEAIVLRSSD